jgi:hypothetical protein
MVFPAEVEITLFACESQLRFPDFEITHFQAISCVDGALKNNTALYPHTNHLLYTIQPKQARDGT